MHLSKQSLRAGSAMRYGVRAASIAVRVMDATVYGGAVGSRTGSLENLD